MAHGTHDAVYDPRNEAILISVNGQLRPRHEATVSVFDSGYLLGDGVWEGIRLHEGVLVFLEAHLQRLDQGARAIALDIGLSGAGLTAALYEVIDANSMRTDVHARLMVTRGVKKTPSQDPRLTVGGPTIVIIAEHKRANPEVNRHGISLFTSTVRRGSPDYLDPRLNCHSKLHEVIALQQALHAGADEALMLDIHGFVSTCNATNFFIVRSGEVWTSTGQYCLNGITRGRIIGLCRAEGIPVHEKNFSLTEVYDADEAFVTGTFAGLIPVHTVDGRAIGPTERPLLRRLQSLYRADIARYVAAHPRLIAGAGEPA
jgi:branched-chain amino acid aminotransferase